MSSSDEEGGGVTVVVVRTSDACRSTVSIQSLQSVTLNSLKDKISESKEFGPIDRNHQRLFHMGRELKSGKRSLVSLGFGKHGNFLLHLLSTQPKTFELSSDEDEPSSVRQKITTTTTCTTATTHKRGHQQHRSGQPVIDLLDDSDEDEDIEVGLLPEPVTRKRQRER